MKRILFSAATLAAVLACSACSAMKPEPTVAVQVESSTANLKWTTGSDGKVLTDNWTSGSDGRVVLNTTDE